MHPPHSMCRAWDSHSNLNRSSGWRLFQVGNVANPHRLRRMFRRNILWRNMIEGNHDSFLAGKVGRTDSTYASDRKPALVVKPLHCSVCFDDQRWRRRWFVLTRGAFAY